MICISSSREYLVQSIKWTTFWARHHSTPLLQTSIHPKAYLDNKADKMHLHWTLPVLTLLATRSTAYLKSNQECGSNNQCSMACKDGDFHPMAYNGTVYFACTTQENHEVKYSLWTCKHIGSMDNIEVCEAASGRWCASTSHCILPNKGDGYEDLCKEKKTEALKVKDNLGYGDVLSEAECRG